MTASEAEGASRNAAARMRPSSAELVREVAVAALQRAPQPPEHTVGLTLNAKGDVQIEVTGRGMTASEAESAARNAAARKSRCVVTAALRREAERYYRDRAYHESLPWSERAK